MSRFELLTREGEKDTTLNDYSYHETITRGFAIIILNDIR